MSQHPSLRSSAKDKQARSVLKRYERIGIMKAKEEWEEKDSVYGLPKIKVVKFKIKKEKAVAAETTVEGAVPAAGAAPAADKGAAKGAPAKGAPAKEAGKAAAPEKKK